MSLADDNRALLMEVLATSVRDPQEMMARFFAPGARFYEPESLPYGGEWAGADRFAEFVKVFADTWSELAFDMKDILTSDTRASTFGFLTMTSRHTGRSATITLCEVWEFSDGKVVRVDAVYGDTVPVLQALGVEPRAVPADS